MIPQITCPICLKPAIDPHTTPFCSNRCRKIDFYRWWDGRYAIRESVDLDLDPETGEMLQNQEGDGNPMYEDR
jgi:uncharacterized protein